MGKKKKTSAKAEVEAAEKQPVLTSYFESLEDVKAVKDAARLAGVSASTLVRDAVMPIVKRIIAKKSGKCPTCGSRVKS